MKEDNNIITHFLKYQAVYALFAWLVASWVLFGARLDRAEDSISTIQKQQETEAIVLSDIRSRLSSIETSILFIKERLQ